MAEPDRILLMPERRREDGCCSKKRLLCPLLFAIGLTCIAIAIGIGLYKAAFLTPVELRVLALNTWGMPYNFGGLDKEKRMVNIGEMIRKGEHDLYLLSELWMRADHETVRSISTNGTGYHMTTIPDLAVYGACDGRATPGGCSGLAIVSKYPIVETEFQVFSVHGDLWYFDGEYEARKGVGRVRIEPQPNITVDVYVSHTAANDYNWWYRQIQTKEIVEHVKKSDADFAILGGDFNIDPRMKNETTYHTLVSELSSAMLEFFKYLEELLRPNRATYANPANTYSGHGTFKPQLYDYIFHKSKSWNTIVINLFEVPFLKGLIKPDTEPNDREASQGELKSLSDHEAVTSHLYLYKYRW